MPKPRDARAQRTADALRAAFLKLLEKKAMDQITVRAITATAGINYATFFRHHDSKEALLDDLAAGEVQRLVDLTLPVYDTVNMKAGILALFTYVHENTTLWTALLTGGAAGIMREELLRLSRIVAVDRALEESTIPRELRVNCTVSLIFETLVWWLNQPPEQHSPQQATETLASLIGTLGLLPCVTK